MSMEVTGCIQSVGSTCWDDSACQQMQGLRMPDEGKAHMQDTTVRELLRHNDILTLPAASKDINWESLWRARLNADDATRGAQDSVPSQ